MKDKVPCPFCNGKGHTILTGVYAETLTLLRKLTSEKESFIVANQHAEQFGCNPTALNNRLKRLEELGFAKSERYGRQRRYAAR